MPLAWFRRRKDDESTHEAVASQPELVSEPAPTPERATPSGSQSESESDATPKPKRRRGNRGGRRRKKPGESAAAGADGAAAEAAPAAKKTEREKSTRERPERKEQSQRAQRRQNQRKESGSARRRPPRRAPLPKAKRELIVSVDAGEKRVAVLEDGRVAEVYLERPEKRSIAGNIYKGVVDNVLPGMEAAFVEIGLEKNGFLYVDEIVGPELEGRKGARKIQDLISKGQEILVQAVKDPMKTKGARLTTEISLPGRFVVYQPLGEGLGVSRRLDDDERTRLKGILKEIAPKKGGVIVRTAAEGASAEDVERDLEFLERLWKTIETQAKGAKPPSLVYQEAELPLRVTRDLFTGDFERAYVDHDRTYKRIVGYLKKTSPHMVERVVRYKEKEPLMDAFGVDAEIKSTLNKRVDLPSGGYLIFDYAEAFTVVDVNTGRFVGGRGKNSNSRLEDTITKNNLEAVKEVVRQLRLRDIGGIIVIDFIDMANPKNRHAVEEALRSELERDRTKTYVVEISPLGLVEMTRQNVTDGPRELMTKKCPTCGGDGIVVSETTAAVEIERRLRTLVTPGSRTQAFRVEVNAKIASLVVGPGATRLAELEETTRRSFFLVGKEDVHLDHFRVLDQGTLEKLKPEAPVEAEKTISVKLGEVDRHDALAAVAHLDGYAVVVAGAANLVGKTVKARIERVLDGIAFATLANVGAKTAPEPITAEAEAERPTRARKTTRRTSEPDAAAHEAEDREDEDEDEQADAVAEEPEAEEADTDAGDEGATATGAPRKRTRRGSRGGRRRKKPGEGAAGAETDAGEPGEAGELEGAVASEPAADVPPEQAEEQETPTADGDEPSPRIHLPRPELGREDGDEDGEAPARKKTRRGSRGGRKRKKTPAAATNGSEQAAAEEARPDGAVAEQSATDEPAAEGAAVEEPTPEPLAEEPVAEEPAAEEESAPKPEEPEEPEAAEPGPSEPRPSGNGDGDDESWDYVPMSEWGDDFRR